MRAHSQIRYSFFHRPKNKPSEKLHSSTITKQHRPWRPRTLLVMIVAATTPKTTLLSEKTTPRRLEKPCDKLKTSNRAPTLTGLGLLQQHRHPCSLHRTKNSCTIRTVSCVTMIPSSPPPAVVCWRGRCDSRKRNSYLRRRQ